MATNSIWETEKQRELESRIGKLTMQSKPLWGKMNAAQMLHHIGASLKMATGELRCAPKGGPLRFAPLRYLIVHVLPIPKGVPTAPELVAPAGAEFEPNLRETKATLQRLTAGGPNRDFPEHPAFGRLSASDWGVLTYKHLDHHLRQFGV